MYTKLIEQILFLKNNFKRVTNLLKNLISFFTYSKFCYICQNNANELQYNFFHDGQFLMNSDLHLKFFFNISKIHFHNGFEKY